MSRTLNVLVAESHPGLAEGAVAQLEEAGHRVHRCYEPDQRGFPCVALQGKPCPLEGPIDVVYAHRLPMTPRPTPLEDGVRCSLRQQVPVVEAGRSALDPFEPWTQAVIQRSEDLVPTLEAVAARRYEPLRVDVMRRISPLLHSAGLSADHVTCRIEPRQVDLDVHIDVDGPEDRSLAQSLAVRVLDAVRSAGRPFGQVDVHVHHTADADSAAS